MKKIILILLSSFLLGKIANAQMVYIDPATTVALTLYSNALKKQQEKTIKEQSKLQKAQAFVSVQMQKANKIQNKIYKGLKEISGTVSNAIQVVDIYNEMERCYTITSEISDLVQQKPTYSIFGVKATQLTIEKTAKISTELTSLITEGELNLATAGDRFRLLNKIYWKANELKLSLLGIKLSIERAIRLGFWKSINPFQGYINTDKTIVENVMFKFRHNF